MHMLNVEGLNSMHMHMINVEGLGAFREQRAEKGEEKVSIRMPIYTCQYTHANIHMPIYTCRYT